MAFNIKLFKTFVSSIFFLSSYKINIFKTPLMILSIINISFIKYDK